MRLPLLVLLASLLCACTKPAWVRAPDFSGWFDSENAVMVQEAARANVCGTAGGESVVSVLPGLAGLQAWAAGRGIELTSLTGKPLEETPYAVVEFGQRPNSGYGLAVSRQAGRSEEQRGRQGGHGDRRRGGRFFWRRLSGREDRRAGPPALR